MVISAYGDVILRLPGGKLMEHGTSRANQPNGFLTIASVHRPLSFCPRCPFSLSIALHNWAESAVSLTRDSPRCHIEEDLLTSHCIHRKGEIMEVRWDTTQQESNPPAPSQNNVDRRIPDQHDPRLTLEMAIEWAHLGGD
jgi:hypothetical protein